MGLYSEQANSIFNSSVLINSKDQPTLHYIPCVYNIIYNTYTVCIQMQGGGSTLLVVRLHATCHARSTALACYIHSCSNHNSYYCTFNVHTAIYTHICMYVSIMYNSMQLICRTHFLKRSKPKGDSVKTCLAGPTGSVVHDMPCPRPPQYQFFDQCNIKMYKLLVAIFVTAM